MTPQEGKKMLAMIADQAPRLRDAGILYFELGDFKIHLAPPPPDVSKLFPKGEAVVNDDPLNDSATFGTDGFVPGFERLRRKEEEL